MKPEPKERDAQILDIAEKQKNLMELVTWAADNYSQYMTGGNLLMQNLTGASEQLHKINLDIVSGKTPVEPNLKSTTNES